ncbi:MAG: hypothetical protein VYE81_00530 [Planctomycetota bacterium]|nr:hypothetical protein [Planctomycetota bacterium]
MKRVHVAIAAAVVAAAALALVFLRSDPDGTPAIGGGATRAPATTAAGRGKTQTARYLGAAHTPPPDPSEEGLRHSIRTLRATLTPSLGYHGKFKVRDAAEEVRRQAAGVLRARPRRRRTLLRAVDTLVDAWTHATLVGVPRAADRGRRGAAEAAELFAAYEGETKKDLREAERARRKRERDARSGNSS